MQCLTCSADIPPQWVNAIQSNICPGCGGNIMSDASKELMTEIREAFKRMPQDVEGISGWLLSNYKITKIGTAEPTIEFHRPRTSETHSDEPLKIAKNPTQQFLTKISEVKTAGKTKAQVLAELANKINNDESLVSDGESYEEEDPGFLITATNEDLPKANPVDVHEFENAIEATDGGMENYANIQRIQKLKQQAQIEGGKAGKNSFTRGD